MLTFSTFVLPGSTGGMKDFHYLDWLAWPFLFEMIPLTKGHRRAAQFQFVTFHRATFCKAKCPEHFAFRVGKRSWGYLFFAVDVGCPRRMGTPNPERLIQHGCPIKMAILGYPTFGGNTISCCSLYIPFWRANLPFLENIFFGRGSYVDIANPLTGKTHLGKNSIDMENQWLPRKRIHKCWVSIWFPYLCQ